jgi:putative oxidoreductase
MDVIVLIGRILFAAIFLGSGIAHLTQTRSMAEYAGAKGVPSPSAAVAGSGVLILVGGLMVLLGIWADLGALFVIAFLVPTALVMHRFWSVTDAMARQLEMTQFMKNISIAGGALIAFAFFAYAGNDLGLTLTGPLFSLR